MDRHTREARREKLRALHKQGLSGSAIARELKITKQRVQQLRSRMGLVAPSPSEAAQARRDKLAPLIRAGHPPHVILGKFPGLTHDQLYRDARAMGIYPQMRQAWKASHLPRRKSPVHD